MRAAGVGGKQGFVGEDVDAPGQALGDPGDHVDGARREWIGAMVAGGAQAEVDVVADFTGLERRQVEVLGDAFAQLAHIIGGESFVEFGLVERLDLTLQLDPVHKINRNLDNWYLPIDIGASK